MSAPDGSGANTAPLHRGYTELVVPLKNHHCLLKNRQCFTVISTQPAATAATADVRVCCCLVGALEMKARPLWSGVHGRMRREDD